MDISARALLVNTHRPGLDRREARPRDHPRDLHDEGRGGQRRPRQQEPAR